MIWMLEKRLVWFHCFFYSSSLSPNFIFVAIINNRSYNRYISYVITRIDWTSNGKKLHIRIKKESSEEKTNAWHILNRFPLLLLIYHLCIGECFLSPFFVVAKNTKFNSHQFFIFWNCTCTFFSSICLFIFCWFFPCCLLYSHIKFSHKLSIILHLYIDMMCICYCAV